MRSDNGSVLVLLLSLVSVLAVVEGIFLIRLGDRVAELEDQVVGTDGEESPRKVGERVKALEGIVADSALGVDSVFKQTDRLEREVQAHARAIRELDLPIPVVATDRDRERDPGRGTEPAVSRDVIEKLVARAVEAKVKEMPQGGGGEWKPSLQQLKDALDLDI